MNTIVKILKCQEAIFLTELIKFNSISDFFKLSKKKCSLRKKLSYGYYHLKTFITIIAAKL